MVHIVLYTLFDNCYLYVLLLPCKAQGPPFFLAVPVQFTVKILATVEQLFETCHGRCD